MKENKRCNILAGDLNYLSKYLHNDYEMTRVGDEGISNIDYIYSNGLETVKKGVMMSTSDHFFLVR